MKVRHAVGQGGFSLLEVLVAALVLGIAITGMTLLMSRGQTAVVTQGDTRIGLYLAEQKIEKLRALGYNAANVGASGHLNYTDAAANSGCPDEPCYNETVQAGIGQQLTSSTQVDKQSFTRLTCVRWVQDDNPELPADPLGPPASWTCPSCDITQANCSKNTKRIKVAVIPLLLGGGAADTSRVTDPDRATLELVLTPTVKP